MQFSDRIGAQTTSIYGVDEETRTSFWSFCILFGKPLVPFLYGMLGALTYLLRSAHSYINDRTFDMARTPEYYNRMLLGFTGGGIILLFVDQSPSVSLTARSHS